MPTNLTTKAQEESSYTITASFTDEDGTAVTPTSATWTLSDTYGNTINSRAAEVITPDTSVDITLTGDDLAISETGAVIKRILTVEAVYDSTYGTGLTLKDTATFQVDNLTIIT